jgi:hypothetical protein
MICFIMTDKVANLKCEISNTIVFQDTTRQSLTNPALLNIQNTNNQTDTTKTNPLFNKTFSEQNIDSIFKAFEERDLQYQQEIKQIQSKKFSPKIDTINLYFENLGIYSSRLSEKLSNDLFQENFLLNIPRIKKTAEVKSKLVFKESPLNQQTQLFTEKQIILKPRFSESKLNVDWISYVLFISIILLGWIKLFFGNQFFSIMKSVGSYHESSSLLREKNTNVERVFFFLNLLFLLTTSVFAVQLASFYNVGLSPGRQYLFFLVVFVSLIGLFVLRGATSVFIGSLFFKQKVFLEYMHNINIYTMSTGIYLLPIIIIIQYLSFEYLGFIVYTGIAGIVLLYLFQLLRSFQIIIRKNVSIFYMILYLCAFEFAPFLIVYKLLLSLN